MFEIVCEVANTSGKTLTIETSIPEAEKPDVQILKSGMQLGVFASPFRSTVKITVVSVENADRIEELERALRKTYAVLLVASLYRGYEGGPLDEPSTAHVVREAKLALGEKKDD